MPGLATATADGVAHAPIGANGCQCLVIIEARGNRSERELSLDGAMPRWRGLRVLRCNEDCRTAANRESPTRRPQNTRYTAQTRNPVQVMTNNIATDKKAIPSILTARRGFPLVESGTLESVSTGPGAFIGEVTKMTTQAPIDLFLRSSTFEWKKFHL
jgi:hypothetical protein